MCTKPPMLADGTLIGCRDCWQCAERKIDDWVGRCIAESKRAVATSSITLTYGRASYDPVLEEWVPDEDGLSSHPKAAYLAYSDVQSYLRRLRKKWRVKGGVKPAYPCRYFVTGEFGGERGRTHWHIIIFWQKAVPPHQKFKRFKEPHWVHGVSFWEPVRNGEGPGSIRYVCKYIGKDINDAEAQGRLGMSKKPPLGAKYFEDRAQRHVDARLAPQDLFYQFPEAKRKSDGKPVNFMLGGKSAALFCHHFLEKWKAQVGGHRPPSEMLDKYEDRVTREQAGKLTAAEIEGYRYGGVLPIDDVILSKPKIHKVKPPLFVPSGLKLADMKFDGPANRWFIEQPDGPRLWSVQTNEGWTWLEETKGGRIVTTVLQDEIRPAENEYQTRMRPEMDFEVPEVWD